MEAERHKRIQLDMYSRRENLRLTGIQEKEQEDVEKIVRGILDETGVLRDNLVFHVVHCVGVKKTGWGSTWIIPMGLGSITVKL